MKTGFSKAMIFSSLILLLGLKAWAQPYTVSSPNGKLAVEVTLSPFKYSVKRGTAMALESADLGVTLATHAFTGNVTFVSQETKEINETYPMPHGKKSVHVNHCKELKLVVSNGTQQLEVYFRAYDKGMAYRYTALGTGTAKISSEASSVKVPANSLFWGIDGFARNYEDPMKLISGGITGENSLPLLAMSPDSQYILVTEASVFATFSGSRVFGSGYNLKFMQGNLPSSTLPWEMPWRVAIIGTLANIVEDANELVDNLNPPSVITDYSWIKPGKASWSWMAERVKSIAQQKAYVDFSATMGFEYCLVDDGWDKFDPAELVTYANTKNVKILFWYRNDDLVTEAGRTAVFNKMIGWGITGLKVDYFGNGDDQVKMKLYEDLMAQAAKNKMMIWFHGTTIPRGERRTYPNVVSREAVRGNEWIGNNGVNGVTAVHTTISSFVRNSIGPVDITPGTISATEPTQSSDAHEMALFLTAEAAITSLSDKPSDYTSKTPDVLDYLKRVPLAYDESKFIEGFPGTHFVIARRKGTTWWIAGVNAETERTINLNLSFLKPGAYSSLKLISDVSASTTGAHQNTVVSVNAPGTFQVVMAKRGGFVLEIPNSATTAIGSSDPLEEAGFNHNLNFIPMGNNQYLIQTSFGDVYDYQVFNQLGQQILAGNSNKGNGSLLNFSKMNSGKYLIRTSNGKQQVSGEITHQRQ